MVTLKLSLINLNYIYSIFFGLIDLDLGSISEIQIEQSGSLNNLDFVYFVSGSSINLVIYIYHISVYMYHIWTVSGTEMNVTIYEINFVIFDIDGC